MLQGDAKDPKGLGLFSLGLVLQAIGFEDGPGRRTRGADEGRANVRETHATQVRLNHDFRRGKGRRIPVGSLPIFNGPQLGHYRRSIA